MGQKRSSSKIGKINSAKSRKSSWKKIPFLDFDNLYPNEEMSFNNQPNQNKIINSQNIQGIDNKYTNIGSNHQLFHLNVNGKTLSNSNIISTHQKKKDKQNNMKINYMNYNYAKALDKFIKGNQHRKNTSLILKKIQNEKSIVKDLWNSVEDSTTPSRNTCNPPLYSSIPSIQIPHQGQSFNPAITHYKDLLMVSANDECRKNHLKLQFEKNLTPITSVLEEYLTHDVLSLLSYLQKIKTYKFIQSLKNPHKKKKLITKFTYNLLSSSSDLTEDMLNYNISSDTQNNESNDDLDIDTATKIRRNSRNKSRKHRNRLMRHTLLLKQASLKKEKKNFLNSLDYLKELKKNITVAEQQRLEKKKNELVQKQLRELNYSKAQNVKFKSGNRYYEDPFIDVILTDDLNAELGSLRKLPLSQVAGSSIKDRFASIYRRKLTELPRRSILAYPVIL